MHTTLSPTATNPHIAALKDALISLNHPVETLVISHNDAQVLTSVGSALSGESAAFLEVSQDLWDFQGEQLPETIEWALQTADIKQLVLVGHSQPGGSTSRVSFSHSESNRLCEGSYAKLLAGVERNNARNRAAQQRFATNVKQMSQIPAVHDRWSSGELAVYALFYRAESGLFLVYDSEANLFRPLAG